MLSSGQNPVRRGMSILLIGLERFKAVDLLLFTAVMLAKLYWFSEILHVANMKMTGIDALIELGAVLLFSFWTIWLPVARADCFTYCAKCDRILRFICRSHLLSLLSRFNLGPGTASARTSRFIRR